MRVPQKVSVGLFLLFLGCFQTLSNEIKFSEITNEEEWEAIFKKAKAENKIVFVDIYTDWCTYCHKLDKEVYTQQGVVDYFNENFINIKFDAETQFGYPLTERYNVTGYPKLLFLTTNEEVFEAIDGFVPANTLLSYGENIADSWNALPGLLAKHNEGTLERVDQLSFIGILERTDREKAESVAADYIKGLKPEDYSNIENLWLVSRFQNQLTGTSYRYISTNKDEIIKIHGKSEYSDYLKSVYNDNLNLAIKYGESNLLERLVLELLPEFVEPIEVPEAAFITKKLYYKERAEFDRFKFEVQAYLNNHIDKQNRGSFLFQTALEIIETIDDKSMYEFAAQLLNESLSTNPENFESTALLGYTNGLMGNYKSASEFLSKAQTFASSQDEKEMVQNLIDSIDLMKTN